LRYRRISRDGLTSDHNVARLVFQSASILPSKGGWRRRRLGRQLHADQRIL